MTHPLRSFLLHGSSLILLGLAGLASAAPQHAVTLYDEPPKYPANFTHFEYTNPDAPKGGTFREAGFGGFDSLNPFISKGVAADDIGLIYDTLAVQSMDEPFTAYGLIAEKIEKAKAAAVWQETNWLDGVILPDKLRQRLLQLAGPAPRLQYSFEDSAVNGF